jgi:glutathione S-transferase
LRYFPVLGRAQSLRLALADRQVVFEDQRVDRAEWARARTETAFGGPFRALPTLSWGGIDVAETLAIASFIAKRTGMYDGLDEAAIARIEAICSCAFIDVLMRTIEAMRADDYFPGSDATQAFPLHAPRILQKLELLEATIGAAEWFGGKEPVTADFFVAEAIEVVAHVLGPARRAAFAARLPSLTAMAQRVRRRASLAAAFETRPPRLTPRPDEDAVIERMRALDLSALRL